MKYVTKRSLIEDLTSTWETQFTAKPQRHKCQTVLEQLRALDLSIATEEEIEAIIGNRSWTMLQCVECNCECDEAVEFAGNPLAGTPPIWICQDCLQRAYRKVGSQELQEESYQDSEVLESELQPA